MSIAWGRTVAVFGKTRLATPVCVSLVLQHGLVR